MDIPGIDIPGPGDILGGIGGPIVGGVRDTFESITGNSGGGSRGTTVTGQCAADDDLGEGPFENHHSFPIFMGGPSDQPLTRMTPAEHQDLHRDLNKFLVDETNDAGDHMRPQCNNNGRDIRESFSEADRLDALARFYSGDGAKYADAAADFFAQYPR